MPLRIPIGIDGFRKLREAGLEGGFVEIVLDEGVHAMDRAAELRAAGASPVFAFAVAFDGKDVRVASLGAKRRAAGKRRR